jgi:hypothetical protein
MGRFVMPIFTGEKDWKTQMMNGKTQFLQSYFLKHKGSADFWKYE